MISLAAAVRHFPPYPRWVSIICSKKTTVSASNHNAMRCPAWWQRCGLALGVWALCHTALAAAPTCRAVAAYPHDQRAFTQGLAFADGELWESTGQYGYSALRRVAINTGRHQQLARLRANLFAEGITLWRDQIVQLTWRSGLGLIYDRISLQQQAEFHYIGEGWGLTTDGQYWIMSDGSARLRFIDPVTYHDIKQMTVRDDTTPVTQLNELEYVAGEVWANVYGRDVIVRIDPHSGAVRGWLDCSALYPPAHRSPTATVMNGMAYDPATQRLFVTGKYWPVLFVLDVADIVRTMPRS